MAVGIREHIEFGSKVAMQNSNGEIDAELHPLREVPRWRWAGDDDQPPLPAAMGHVEVSLDGYEMPSLDRLSLQQRRPSPTTGAETNPQ